MLRADWRMLFYYGIFLYEMFTPYNDILSNDGLFKFQSDAIRKLVSEQSCVLVVAVVPIISCAMIRIVLVFIHNNMENRIQRILESQNITVEQAKELMGKTDKSRQPTIIIIRIKNGV